VICSVLDASQSAYIGPHTCSMR